VGVGQEPSVKLTAVAAAAFFVLSIPVIFCTVILFPIVPFVITNTALLSTAALAIRVTFGIEYAVPVVKAAFEAVKNSVVIVVFNVGNDPVPADMPNVAQLGVELAIMKTFLVAVVFAAKAL